MNPKPRTLLIARLCGVLLIGLGAAATARLIVRLVLDPEVWVDAWDGREGGPLAIIGQVVTHWCDVLTSRGMWDGAPLIGTISGGLILLRTRWCLRRVQKWGRR